ncbi:MAG: radical SAM protein [Muribaculaceae bacterium]|nr:radical SAM protein [Muribaculaceae bacterium]
MDQFITFNPDYVLKPDEGRTLVMATLVGRNRLNGISDSFTNTIHPIYAMILSFIDGREYYECINEASQILETPKELIDGFIKKLVNNPQQVFLKSGNKISAFPPNTIITIPSKQENHRYSPELFSYSEVDLSMRRHRTPSRITLMVNNVCHTNCVYCYQDKRKVVKCTIPLNRIFKLIQEAHELDVKSFDVIGGEFFLYEHWREVLCKLREYGYNPYLSTKIPLSEDDIKFLSKTRICDLQISLDSLIEEHLIPSLKVAPGYADKMIHSLYLLEQYNIPVMVHSVLSKYNDSINDMKSVYEIIKNLSNLIDWHVVKGDESLYSKENYQNIKIDSSSQNSIIDYLEELKKEGKVKIRIPERVIENRVAQTHFSPNQQQLVNFLQRPFCSGLYSSLYILPDGNVTICEQLYWNNKFIVGNILEQNLNEVWNSDKAKDLFYIKQEDIPTDSLCHSCNYFTVCRNTKQVCYREIIRKYGSDKWYYPDTNCPFSKLT